MTTKQGGIKDIALGRVDNFRLRLEDIHIRPEWNCRDVDFSSDDADDLALALSISEVGVKEPLTVAWDSADGKAYVTNGHRRRAAALYAKHVLGAEIESVPVQTEGRHASEADRVLSMIVRNSGKPLTPIEQGRVFKRLNDLGWSEKQIAAKAGITDARVRQLLTLQAAPLAVTEMVKSGAISASLATKALSASGGDGQKATASLTKAVDNAKAAGKTRATAKHMAPQPSLRTQLKDAFDASTVDEKLDELDAYVIIMPAEQFEIVRSLLKL